MKLRSSPQCRAKDIPFSDSSLLKEPVHCHVMALAGLVPFDVVLRLLCFLKVSELQRCRPADGHDQEHREVVWSGANRRMMTNYDIIQKVIKESFHGF